MFQILSDWTLPDWRKLVAEFTGTFALIFFGAGSIMITGGDLVTVALAHGLAIALLVSALGHVSGGLFNPALTIGLWVTRRMSHIDTAGYIVAQLVGATAAALLLKVLYLDGVFRGYSGNGIPTLGQGVAPLQGIGVEIVLTVFLMLAVFGTAIDARGPKLGGFAIGLVITMGILAAGPLTGAAMNPARAFGPELANMSWADWAIYWVGPIVGAVGAALLYHYVFLDDQQRMEGSAAAQAAPGTM